MKILIWIGCFTLPILLDVFLIPMGVRLGYAIRYLITIPLAIFLCKKWDEHRGVKSLEKIPISCIREAEQYKGKPTELSAYLKSCLKTKKLTKAQAKYLYKSYCKDTYND